LTRRQRRGRGQTGHGGRDRDRDRDREREREREGEEKRQQNGFTSSLLNLLQAWFSELSIHAIDPVPFSRKAESQACMNKLTKLMMWVWSRGGVDGRTVLPAAIGVRR